MSDAVDITTPDGHHISDQAGLARYNDQVIDRTIEESRAHRKAFPDRVQARVEAAVEGEGRSYIKARTVGRKYFFGMGIDVSKLKGGLG